MELKELIIKEIFDYMITEKLNIPKIELNMNGDKYYTASGDLTIEEKDKFDRKLRDLTTIEERIKLLVKHKYGSFPKMDKIVGISGHRVKYNRLVKKIKKSFDLLDADINIKSK